MKSVARCDGASNTSPVSIDSPRHAMIARKAEELGSCKRGKLVSFGEGQGLVEISNGRNSKFLYSNHMFCCNSILHF